MGKIIHTQKTEKGDINYIAATVSFVSDGLGDMADKVVNVGVTLDVWNPETKKAEKKYLQIGFWNNDDPQKPQFAAMVRKAKVGTGSFLLFKTGTFKEGTKADDGVSRINATGFSFQYSDRVEIPIEGKDPLNIICGTARRTRLRDEGVFSANIPVTKIVNGEKVDTWYSITFKDGGKNTIGTRASKAISDGSPLCVLTGKITENTTSDGRVFNNALAFDFSTGFVKSQE